MKGRKVAAGLLAVEVRLVKRCLIAGNLQINFQDTHSDRGGQCARAVRLGFGTFDHDQSETPVVATLGTSKNYAELM